MLSERHCSLDYWKCRLCANQRDDMQVGQTGLHHLFGAVVAREESVQMKTISERLWRNKKRDAIPSTCMWVGQTGLHHLFGDAPPPPLPLKPPPRPAGHRTLGFADRSCAAVMSSGRAHPEETAATVQRETLRFPRAPPPPPPPPPPPGCLAIAAAENQTDGPPDVEPQSEVIRAILCWGALF